MGIGFLVNAGRKVMKVTVKHSPKILTSLGVVGTVSTAVMTGKAAVKARDVIAAHEMDDELRVEKWEENKKTKSFDVQVYYRERTFTEKAKLTWRIWAAPVLMGGATISCIIGANTISTRRNLALAAAYSMSEEAAKEFKDKVIETVGEKKVNKMENEIMQDKVVSNPEPDEENITYTGDGEQLIYDAWNGRYFKSSQQEIDKKINMLNKRMCRTKDACTANDLYEILGLPPVDKGDDFGWYYNQDCDDGDVTVHYYPVFSSRQTPCIGMKINPVLLYTYNC